MHLQIQENVCARCNVLVQKEELVYIIHVIGYSIDFVSGYNEILDCVIVPWFFSRQQNSPG